MATAGLEIDDPVDLLLFADEDFLAGRYSLYPWQIRILKDFAQNHTSAEAFKAVVRAANGSGKDKYIIAPCAVWLAMRYPQSVCVVTSSSGTQLDRQTDRYIKSLAQSINKRLGFELWKINYRHYECQFPQPDGASDNPNSFIELFVTDEAGRAEGWHPIGYNTKLAIFTSEAKSIPDEIFNALARCTGFTHRVDVSTPGLPIGHFFNRCTGDGWRKYHITAYECPHISRDYIEQCRNDYGGEGSSLFKSMVLAEFGTTDEMVVIPYHVVYRCLRNEFKIPWFKEDYLVGGLDLAAGGDETVFVIRNGNKVVKVIGFREEDTNRTISRLESIFRSEGFDNPRSKIFGDAGGLGKPILDQLKNGRGWLNIRYVLNNGRPRDERAYYNRGTEMWFNFSKLCERGEILLLDDELSKRQLTTRYYKQTEGNKLLLESKLQARAKGHPSPDRADAHILAFSDYKSKLDDNYIIRDDTKLPIPRPKIEVAPEDFTLKGLAKRVATSDVYDKFYGGQQDRRANLAELEALVKEHNEKIKKLKELAV